MLNNRVTQSIIVGAATLVATATWSGLKNILFNDGYWLWPCIGFLILSIFLSLNWLLTKSRAVLLTTLAFILISFFFTFGLKLEYLAILFVAFLFFLFGSLRAISEKKIRIKIQVERILRRGLPALLTGLALVIAMAYYFSPLALKSQGQIDIPRPLFDIVSKPIISSIESTLEVSKLDSGDFLYQAINQEINKLSQAYREYFPLGIALAIFLALKAIGFLFMWLVILLSWLIFKILVSTGAIKIQEKAVLKQVIEI